MAHSGCQQPTLGIGALRGGCASWAGHASTSHAIGVGNESGTAQQERGANGKQPLCSDCIRESPAAASRASRSALGNSTHMRTSLLLSLLVALAAASCRYPDEFKNTPSNAPHALLRGTTYPNGGHAFATHINAQPTTFWRSGDTFRIPPETNSVRAAYSDARETIGYRPEELVAVAGRQYVIAREQDPAAASPLTAVPHPTTPNAWIIYDRRDRVTIRERQQSLPGRIVTEAPREDYIFGQSARELAVAEYRRKNP
jgi:hypothetical protein